MLDGSDLRPRVLSEDDLGVVIASVGDSVDPLEALARLPRTSESVSETRRALLRDLDSEFHLPRALGKLGIARKHVDRYLDRRVELELEWIAPGFGGTGPSGWRDGELGPVTLRCDRVRPRGWWALECEALGERGQGEAADLAHLAIALRAWRMGASREEVRDTVAPIVVGRPEPDRVRVFIEGAALAEARWELPGAEVPIGRARWLLREIDGLFLGGEQVGVRVEPPIRAGRKAPRREPRAIRQGRLFSRWNEGTRVDDEGLVGLTPEALAMEIASRAAGVVIDGTCGAGGLTIALARQSTVKRVIAVDVDATRLSMARHNASLYGVESRIEWVCGDVVEWVADRDADVLVLDPPWGGRAYDRTNVGIDDLGFDVAAVLARFDNDVLLKLPRSFDLATLPGHWQAELLLDAREIPKLILATRVT